MSRPEVSEWMLEQGHMSREEFLSWAEEFADADEPAEELEQAIVELHADRDRLLENLRSPEVRARLFPRREGLATKEEREREALKPGRLAWKLGWEIRHEYLAREVGLANYSRELFVQGVADDYLVRGPISEHDHERHARMVEARQAAARELEASYEKALALR
jgi:hypothetical protein